MVSAVRNGIKFYCRDTMNVLAADTVNLCGGPFGSNSCWNTDVKFECKTDAVSQTTVENLVDKALKLEQLGSYHFYLFKLLDFIEVCGFGQLLLCGYRISGFHLLNPILLFHSEWVGIFYFSFKFFGNVCTIQYLNLAYEYIYYQR